MISRSSRRLSITIKLGGQYTIWDKDEFHAGAQSSRRTSANSAPQRDKLNRNIGLSQVVYHYFDFD